VTVTKIRNEVEKVRGMLNKDVDSFLESLNPTPSESTTSSAEPPQPIPSSTSPPSKSKSNSKPKPKPLSQAEPSHQNPYQKTPLELEHTRLAELLLQSLLRLDAINVEGEWEVARKERKAGVKEVQGLLDRLDGGWRGRKV